MARHVGIIGAGISGLRAAEVLLENSIKVTIIEARDRIGGRITQTEKFGRVIDVGANWVHSTGANPIVDLAAKTDTPLHLWEQTTIIVDGTGKLVDSEVANKTLEHVWTILEKAGTHSAENSTDIPASASLYHFFVQESDSLVAKMAEMWGAYVGAGVRRQSLKFFFLEDCIEGDDCFIASNYSKIMARIAERPLKEADIQLNKKMVSVEPNSTGSVVVKTTDGQEQIFDDVLVTCPLGWLKHNLSAIPTATPRLSQAISSVSFGRLEKVFLRFPHAFWDEKTTKDIKTDSSSISFTHWLKPTYAPDTNPQNWRLETVSFAAFPEPYKMPVLLFYIFGDCATHITSMVHGLEGQARDQKLDEFFEPYYSRLPNYNAETCKPTEFLATEWCQDELSGYGCYCDFQVGMTDAAKDVETMRYGMPEQHIYFAGEHTAPFDGLGTVTGAYNSGQKVAERIVGVEAPVVNGVK